MSAAPYFTCKHGMHDGEPCDECLIHWSEHCIESARQNIAKHERKIAELRAKIDTPSQQSPTAATPASTGTLSPQSVEAGPLSEPKEGR